MKIGIDIRTAGGEKAGKGWFTFNITRELLRIDKKNQYFLYTDSGIAGFEEFENTQLVIIESQGLAWHRAVMKDLKKQEVEIFLAPSSFIIPALLPKKSPIKTIVTVHDLIAFLYPTTHNKKAVILEKLLLKRALKKATHLTAVSENTKKDLIEKFSTPEEKISLIKCAAADHLTPIERTEKNLKNLKRFRSKTSLPHKFFLSVGTIEPRKNYETLIQAFAMIHKKLPNHHLLIVGGQGWGKNELEELIRKNYLQKYVHFLGYVTSKTLNRLYNLAEAFVFPSHYEGFGMPPLEAMQAGCPVIASRTSSIPEVVGEAAVLCDPGNPAEFAKAMDSVAKNEHTREDLINKGRIQSKNFSWEDSAQKLYSLIKTL